MYWAALTLALLAVQTSALSAGFARLHNRTFAAGSLGPPVQQPFHAGHEAHPGNLSHRGIEAHPGNLSHRAIEAPPRHGIFSLASEGTFLHQILGDGLRGSWRWHHSGDKDYSLSSHRLMAWRPWVSGQEDGTWISRVQHWHDHHNLADTGVSRFFGSAVVYEWAVFVLAFLIFIVLHLYLIDWPSSRWYHCMALFIWLTAAMLYNAVLWVRLGPEAGETWFVGYCLEFVFSIENVFIYHIVVEAFKLPRKPAQKALFIVVCCQVAFQMVFFMGLANALQSLRIMPYILGAWLLYVGAQSMREGDHVSFNGQESVVFRLCQFTFGNRFSPGYQDDNSVFFTGPDGRTMVSLLMPAIFCLLMVDFVMEVDVTLTKIAEIDNHYIGFTSSVAAAFAVPELFFVARDMFRRFYLLKYGVSFVLLFFGMELLLNSVVHIPDLVGIGIIAGMMVMCIFLSVLLGYQPRKEDLLEDENGPERHQAKQCFEPRLFDSPAKQPQAKSETEKI
mmetsp:Transcript_58747/g.182490  ORF Transcript_58747/g.182490 Transcript_58747/m.182490 type:complete len:504 (-) Transcript_58747:30-1541(-)